MYTQRILRSTQGLESIFSLKPSPGEARGDPHLWSQLKVSLSGLAPATIDDFPALLHADRVGMPLSDGDEIRMVERSRTSFGLVSALSWHETGLPLLGERDSAAVAAVAAAHA